MADRLVSVQVGVRSDLETSRHVFRGETAYIISDPISFSSHRLSIRDYEIFVAIDSEETLGATFEDLVERRVLTEEQEESFYGFILAMHNMGFLSLPISNDKALYQRFVRKRAGRKKEFTRGFMFLRVPLINPDALLTRTIRFARPLFTRTAFVIWLAVMALCTVLVVRRFDDLVEPLSGLLAAQNLLGMWCLLIGLKVVHEFGHAYACKHFGGNVPEMGAYVIMMTPCAYVDATASWGFTKKRDRIIVCLGGMYFESFAAALSLFIWCLTGPGIAHSLAYQAMVLASITTVGFNINPLMRYDGYFILSDALEIPNLRKRASAALSGVMSRLVLSLPQEGPAQDLRTRISLITYGIASSIYRVGLMSGIAMILVMKFRWIGMVLAALVVGGQLFGLIMKLIRFLLFSERTAPVRFRSVGLATLLVVVFPALVLFFPVSGRVVAAGVIGREVETVMHAKTNGYLAGFEVRAGELVAGGQSLIRLENIELDAALAEANARRDAAQWRFRRAEREGTSEAEQARHHWAAASRVAEDRAAALTDLDVQAVHDGFLLRGPRATDIGRFVLTGDELVTIGQGGHVIRVLLTAEEMVSAAPEPGHAVECRSAVEAGRVVTGIIEQVAPAGSRRVAHPMLTHQTGGAIGVDPATGEALQPFFEVTIRIAETDVALQDGARAWVRFATEQRTIAVNLYRRFLRLENTISRG